MSGFKLDDVLKKLEKSREGEDLSKTAAETFVQNLSKDDPVTEPEKVEETTKVAEVPEDQEKIAQEFEDQGRIMARGFMNELNKLAVGTEVMTPNPDAVPKINPAAELAQTEMPAEEPDIQAVVGEINRLRQATMVGAREHGQSGTVTDTPHKKPEVEGAPPVVYDQAKAQLGSGAVNKLASDEIVGTLYQHYFGEED